MSNGWRRQRAQQLLQVVFHNSQDRPVPDFGAREDRCPIVAVHSNVCQTPSYRDNVVMRVGPPPVGASDAPALLELPRAAEGPEGSRRSAGSSAVLFLPAAAHAAVHSSSWLHGTAICQRSHAGF